MTVNAITDTEKGRTGIAPTYLHTTLILDCLIYSVHVIIHQRLNILILS